MVNCWSNTFLAPQAIRDLEPEERRRIFQQVRPPHGDHSLINCAAVSFAHQLRLSGLGPEERRRILQQAWPHSPVRVSWSNAGQRLTNWSNTDWHTVLQV